MRPTLRPYQERAVVEILACLERGIRGTLYTLPTAGGKTVIFSEVISDVARMGWDVAVLVHRRELLHQSSRMLTRAGIGHGIIAPGHPMTDEPVQVASIDTVGARMDRLRDRLQRFRLAVLDEAHHLPAAKWAGAVREMTGAQLLGVTATPFRTDGKGLGEFFNVALRGPSIRRLIDQGFLSDFAVFAPPNQVNLQGVRKRGGDYVAGEVARVVDTDDLTQQAVREYARICPGEPAIAFCATVAHAQHVAAAFTRAGWLARSVDGRMATGDRDRAIQDLAEGRIQVLTSCEIISEGTDVPIVSAAILLRPTASTVLYLQQVGRVLRINPGKERAYILDLVGNVGRHGMPDAERQWDLKGGLRGLERAVEGTRRCGSCWHVCAMGPARCPACGTPYPAARTAPPRPAAGLHLLTDAQIARMQHRNLLDLARTEHDLRRIAAVRGYKPAWVSYVMRERRGVA